MEDPQKICEEKKIVAHVPLFSCVSENECQPCESEGNTPTSGTVRNNHNFLHI